jgi:hypothetical protein
VFHIFIGDIWMKPTSGAQMNTNLNMLPVSGEFVHTRAGIEHDTNAQIFSKMAPL